MKKILKSFALVFALFFGLCAFSACGKDKTTPPEPPAALTESQVKTVLTNFINGVSENFEESDKGFDLAAKDESISSGYSKLGLDDNEFMQLTSDDAIYDCFDDLFLGVGCLYNIKDEAQIIGKPIQINSQRTTRIVYVESATVEKIVVYMKETDTSDSSVIYTVSELYLNSLATKINKIVEISSSSTYVSVELDSRTKFTHVIISRDSGSIDVTQHKVNKIIEFNILARQGFADANLSEEDTGTMAAAIYSQLITTDPATLGTSVEAKLAGKTPKVVAPAA